MQWCCTSSLTPDIFCLFFYHINTKGCDQCKGIFVISLKEVNVVGPCVRGQLKGGIQPYLVLGNPLEVAGAEDDIFC